MTLIFETSEEYHARQALSAGMAWTMVTECPLLAWYQSAFNPGREEKNGKHFDIGTAAHLGTLEEHKLAERIVVLDCENYRTKAAQETRDGAYEAGKIPLLAKDWELVREIGHMIDLQCDLFRHGGPVEATYVWEWEGVPCKARADKIAGNLIVDLKTAASASPQAFQRAMIRDGHHLRAAWYVDGYRQAMSNASVSVESRAAYRYVVVGKDEPHIVTQFELDARSLEWGRRLYRRALSEFRRAQETGVWSGYGREGENKITMSLPAFAEHQLADLEAEGEL
jgi:hypothetical protein